MGRHSAPAATRRNRTGSRSANLGARAGQAPGVLQHPQARAVGTLAAFTVGAVIAAGESVVAAIAPGPATPALAALLPVADRSTDSVPPDGVGGDQPLVEGLTAGRLDPGSEFDLASLTKAVQIGQQLAREQDVLATALAGGAPEAVLVDDQAYVPPVVGRVTSAAGPRWGRQHYGLDVANRIGTPIFAVTEGVVEKSGPASGFGLWVVLRHPDGTRSVYGHINRAFVQVGDRVAAGERIAEVGNRGFSTGPHLHLEIRTDSDRRLDPTTWLRERGIDV